MRNEQEKSTKKIFYKMGTPQQLSKVDLSYIKLLSRNKSILST